jgi:hypothetical protein
MFVSSQSRSDTYSTITNPEYLAFCTIFGQLIDSKTYNRFYHWDEKCQMADCLGSEDDMEIGDDKN